jgi:hypothetical protein
MDTMNTPVIPATVNRHKSFITRFEYYTMIGIGAL